MYLGPCQYLVLSLLFFSILAVLIDMSSSSRFKLIFLVANNVQLGVYVCLLLLLKTGLMIIVFSLYTLGTSPLYDFQIYSPGL